MADEIRITSGGLAVDDRGTVTYFNDFQLEGVKRCYQLENFSNSVVRAWHGHLKEGKYVFVSQGSIILGVVILDDTLTPSKDNEVTRIILSSRDPKLVFIPPGYANGFRSLEENTKVVFFSTSTLEESRDDDYRFPFDYWGKDVWETTNR